MSILHLVLLRKEFFNWIFERFSRISFTAVVISQVILVLILMKPPRTQY